MADIYQADDYFGVCPTCLNAGGCNIRREYWMYCREHRVKWRIGENLFSGCRYETEEQWSKNAELLKDFREIEAHSSYQNSIPGDPKHPNVAPCACERCIAPVLTGMAAAKDS